MSRRDRPRSGAEDHLRSARKRGHHAIAAAVIADGQFDLAGCGAGGLVPDEHALFEIGSITKPITGVLLADMHLRGEVDLTDPLSRHLPDAGPRWRGAEPTLLDLATHRSGLPNSPLQRQEQWFGLGWGTRDPWAGIDAEDYRRLLRGLRPKPPKGGRIAYSSIGFGLLGDALAHAAGVPYEQLLRERVLAPLGMDATGIVPRGPVLQGYSPRGKPRPPMVDPMAAAGGLTSSTSDMSRLLAACLAPGREPPGPALELAQQPVHRLGRGTSIGLGWLILTERGREPHLLHTGGTWGFASVAAISPRRGRAVVVLANTARPVAAIGMALLGKPEKLR